MHTVYILYWYYAYILPMMFKGHDKMPFAFLGCYYCPTNITYVN